ncbi:hypothetical protein WA026_019664 [Henosepilachna vigintioctopunctata]|uniref:FHA domain-containing protein n=1 Tax=Henosepilachna vigintioctopunctata TaxID=420089 RepID=A0AAW1UEW5_9CUCU
MEQEELECKDESMKVEQETAIPKENDTLRNTSFKKPILVGKIGRLPKKVDTSESKTKDNPQTIELTKETGYNQDDNSKKNMNVSAVHNNADSIQYIEPTWSGVPKMEYNFEVLKDGVVIDTINLINKPYWVFGRLANCDIAMQHPTISRYHCVIQYRCEASEEYETGFYIYDLGSTHGTFLNKNKVKPKVYVRIQVGHMLKLGCSTRSYLLNGPEEDKESESELSVSELKQKRQELITMMEDEKRRKLELIQKEEEERQKEKEERLKREEERGIDWGMGEDADEETDLSENPFAQTMNEELYLDDPKKTLRGYFEREGLELEYDCSEQGMGQFLCKVELPIDDERGRSIYAEVLHKGKKKEAVVQCALEACRILDRHGLLRKAIHESRKRKVKDWAENDYYDSDDDTFLDRTGAIEKKREKRMSANIPLKAETYESLLEREQKLHLSIREVENQLTESQKQISCINNSVAEEDSLDAFMKNLKDSKPDKSTISKLKNELAKLKLEHAKVIKLVNVVRPASLPPLIPQYASDINKTNNAKSKVMPIFGKRRKIPVSVSHTNTSNCDKFEENEEEEVNDDEQNQQKLSDPQKIVTNPLHPTHVPEIKQTKDEKNNLSEIEGGDDITQGEKNIRTESTIIAKGY